MSDSTAAQLIEELLAEAEPFDDGSFSVDRSAAADKLERFRYESRDRFLIPTVEGLFLLGVTELSVDELGEDLVLRAPLELEAPELTLGKLRVLGAFGEGARERGVSRLGVGLDMALGHRGIERIVVCYSDERGGVVTQLGEGVEGDLQRIPRRKPEGLELIFDRRFLRRFGLNSLEGDLNRLRNSVFWSPRSVSFDGEGRSGYTRRLEYEEQHSEPGFHIRAGFVASRTIPSNIGLWSADIEVERVAAPHRCFHARIDLDAPRYDLSQTVVRDEVVERALAVAAEMQEQAMSALAADEPRLGPDWPPERVAKALGRPPPPEPAKLPATTARPGRLARLLSAPTWILNAMGFAVTGIAVVALVQGWLPALLGGALFVALTIWIADDRSSNR